MEATCHQFCLKKYWAPASQNIQKLILKNIQIPTHSKTVLQHNKYNGVDS